MTDTPQHDAQGQFTHTIDQARLDAEAAELMAAGSLSYRDLGKILHVSHTTARDRVLRALAAVPADAVADLREVKGAQYAQGAREMLMRAHDPRRDDAAQDRAYRLWLLTQEKFVDLFGLRVPVVHKVEVSDSYMTDIERLQSELGLNDPASAETGARGDATV